MDYHARFSRVYIDADDDSKDEDAGKQEIMFVTHTFQTVMGFCLRKSHGLVVFAEKWSVLVEIHAYPS